MGLTERIAAWGGIDFHQYIHLLKTSIRMDFRSENLMPSRRGSSSVSPLLVTIIFNLVFSLSIVLVMLANFSFGILIAFTYSMVSLSLVVLIEFGSTLINPDDLQIIGARPVSSRTYFAVKLSNLLFYVGLFALALNLLPAIVGTFLKGSRPYYPLLHLAVGFLAALFTTGILAAAYGILLKLFNPERFKDIITYGQILLSFLIFLSYQIIPRSLSRVGGTIDTASPWLYLAPPSWFARMVELGLGQHSAANLYSTLLGIAAVAVTYGILLRTLSLRYAEQVTGQITTRRVKAPKEGTAGARPWTALVHRLFLPHSQERAIFYFIVHMFRNSRFIKRQFYPNVGINLAIFALNAFQHQGSNPFVAGQFEFSFSIIVPVITFIMITSSVLSLLPYSDEYAGQWIFDVAPLADKQRILAGIKKAVILLFYPPLFLLNFLLFAYFWSWSDAFWHAGYGLAAGLVFLQVNAFFFSAIPFTQPVVKGRAQVSVLLIVTLMPIVSIVLIGLQVLVLRGQGLTAFSLLCIGMLALAGLLNRLSNAVYGDRPLLSAERE